MGWTLVMQASESPKLDVSRDAHLTDSWVEPSLLKFVGREGAGEEATIVHDRLRLDDEAARQFSFSEDHWWTRTSGTKVTNRPPQSAMPASCETISSWRFHGKMATKSGRVSKIRS